MKEWFVCLPRQLDINNFKNKWGNVISLCIHEIFYPVCLVNIRVKTYKKNPTFINNLNFAEILCMKDKSGENIQSNDIVFLIF